MIKKRHRSDVRSCPADRQDSLTGSSGDGIPFNRARLKTDVGYIKHGTCEMKSHIYAIEGRLTEIETGNSLVKSTLNASAAAFAVIFAFCARFSGNSVCKIQDALKAKCSETSDAPCSRIFIPGLTRPGQRVVAILVTPFATGRITREKTLKFAASCLAFAPHRCALALTAAAGAEFIATQMAHHRPDQNMPGWPIRSSGNLRNPLTRGSN
ncbi:hypothetical protein [Erwinia amylovora]|uniref:hypothetical protein n=1 Tax=Erwinia amylovora TaxID=552 RepID=UPI00068860E2|nr:hypothetical protein [Erwinia amylovora]